MVANTPADRLSLLSLVNAALRYRGLVWRVTAVAVAATIGISLLLPQKYTAITSFHPQARNSSSAGGAASMLPGLAAELGLLSPLAEGTQSSAFYVELLQSRQILGTIVTQRFPTAASAEPRATLIDLLDVKGDTPAIRRERAIEKLADAMDAVASQRTGIITLSVTFRDPVLAEAVTRRILEEVQRFNLESRQSQARAERRFAGQRLDEVERDLRAGEDRLQAFLQGNRDYRNSPALTFEYDRLTRAVAMQQNLVTNLAQSFEQAKMEEVRDTPVITVVDPPERPAQPDRRHLLIRAILATLLGALVGLAVAFLREGMARTGGAASPEFHEFRELRREALANLRLRRRKTPA